MRKCSIGIHKWEELDVPQVPIKNDALFSHYEYMGHYELARCSVCGKEQLMKCTGSFTYHDGQMKTKAECLAEHSGAKTMAEWRAEKDTWKR